MSPELETVLTRLQDAGIDASVGTAPPAHIEARMHDPEGGADIRCAFRAGPDGSWPAGAIAAWLIETATRLYPDRMGKTQPPHPGLW
jgi:hypothetical protein